MEISVPASESTAPLPLLVHFDTAPPKEVLEASDLAAGTARVGCYALAKGARSAEAARAPALVIAETAKVRYRGSVRSTLAAVDPRRYAIGVRDRSTGSVKLYALSAPSIVQLRREIKRGAGAERKFSDDTLTYGEKRAQLTDSFGSKRFKIKAKTIAASSLPKEVKDVAEEIRLAAFEGEGDVEMEEAQEQPFSDMPPYNPEATSPDEAFSIGSGVLTEGEWASVENVARVLVEKAEGTTEEFEKWLKDTCGTTGEFVTSSLELLRLSGQSEEKKVRWATIVLAICFLARILHIRSHELGKKKLQDTAYSLFMPESFLYSISRRFGEQGRDSVQARFSATMLTQASQTAIVNHILVLVLSVQGWAVSPKVVSELSSDLHLPLQRVEHHLVRIGCHKKRVKDEENSSVQGMGFVMSAPITPVNVEVRIARGKKKAQ